MDSIFTKQGICGAKGARVHANTGMLVRLAGTAVVQERMMIGSATWVISEMWSSRVRMHIIRISWQMFGLVISGVGRSSFTRTKMILGTGSLKIVLRPDIRAHELDARSLDERSGNERSGNERSIGSATNTKNYMEIMFEDVRIDQ